jgi:signal transduction histidine kinase
MQTRSLFAQQSRNLFIFMVVIGYILTFLTASLGNNRYSGLQIIFGILMGIAYLVLGLFDTELLQHLTSGTGNFVFFFMECALVLGIGLTLGPGGNWLIGLPLASLAVERLSPRWRWPVYIGILLTVILPILRYSTWNTALMNALFIAPAIFFVVLITQVRLNEQYARENAERLTSDLEAANHRLAEYASQVEEMAAIQERNRLAREIHDNLGHYLTIVNVQIEAAKMTLELDPPRALDALNKAQELSKKGLNSVRESVAALRISPVENRPLGDAIAELVEESRATGITTEFKLTGEERSVEPKSALAMYRTAQEGLTNIRKHSQASQAFVELDFSQPDRIRLLLRDDGVGAVNTSGGFGLIGIRERVQLLGGECKVETTPNQGFCLEVSLPGETGRKP